MKTLTGPTPLRRAPAPGRRLRTARVVVGTDGSPPSLTALRWAALEAERRGVELTVVLAYNWRALATRVLADHDFEDYVRDLAASIVDAAVAEIRTIAPHLPVDGFAAFGEPAPVLLSASAAADMVVVGCGSPTGPPTRPAESVCVKVATRAACPVTAVVRGRNGRRADPVVVGVDGSAPADAATGVAFDEAARRRCPLLVALADDTSLPARAEHPAHPPGLDGSPSWTRAELEVALLGHVEGWRDLYPDVPVEYAVSRGDPGALLTAWSWHGQLVVVGSRRQGSALRPLLGPVARRLIHHAGCPVLIARPRVCS